MKNYLVIKLSDNTIIGKIVKETLTYYVVARPMIMEITLDENNNTYVYADKYDNMNNNDDTKIYKKHIIMSYKPCPHAINIYTTTIEKLNTKWDDSLYNVFLKAHDIPLRETFH
ncbi:MAG: hypothetical protein COA52_00325 [Hyphomicrobiales bacterium]|nr:MAG: hypothetical protein COA52_00325 [Hyphomicrobiales bacterium]